MTRLAVVQTGGKQYLVKENDEIVVERISEKEDDKIKVNTLGVFDSEKEMVELGNPSLKNKIEAKILAHVKGDKLRISRFKSKVRYRKVKGFRPSYTKIKILKI